MQAIVAHQVKPAVARPGAGKVLAEDEQRHDGAGAHALAALRRCLVLQLAVDRFELLADVGEERCGAGRLVNTPQRFDNQATRTVALAGAADAVGDRPEAEIRAPEERVLIDLAHLADMGDGCGSEAEARRRRGPRRDGMPYRVFHPHCSHFPSSSAAKRSTDGRLSAKTSDGLQRSEPL